MTDHLDWKTIEDAAIASAQNAGAAKDIFMPDYGWIMRDGNLTEEGLQWYKDNQEALEGKK